MEGTGWADAHGDVLMDLAVRRARGERKVLASRYLEGYESAGLRLLVCSLFVEDRLVPRALPEALLQVGALLEEQEETPGRFRLCRCREELRETLERGELALVLSLEGVEPLGRDLGLLRVLRELGVCLMGLTWSRRNEAADGCVVEGTSPLRPGGLSPFGLDLVREAQRLGIVPDVSHLNDPGFEDVAALGGLFLASHSNCRALLDHPRNLTDSQIRAVAASGGVVGFNAHAPFVGGDGDPCDRMLRHLEHLVEVGGPDHAALGLDLCDPFFALAGEQPKDLFRSHEEAARCRGRLVERFGPHTTRKILRDNLVRVVEAALPD